MLKMLRKIFHKHEWYLYDCKLEQHDVETNKPYNTYIYKCSICGKKKETVKRA